MSDVQCIGLNRAMNDVGSGHQYATGRVRRALRVVMVAFLTFLMNTASARAATYYRDANGSSEQATRGPENGTLILAR